MNEARDAHRMLAQRCCYLCRRPLADAEGVYWPSLGILVHDTSCSVVLHGELRTYDHSRRGRWRPRREVLARLRSYWSVPAAPPAANLLRELDTLERARP